MNNMDKFELQRLRDLPIEGVAERLGLQVCRHKSLCPFHDDHHASLSFSVRRNTYRCFACGAHGGPIDLTMALLHSRGGGEGAPFLEACRWLADENSMIIHSDSAGSPHYGGDVQKGQRGASFDASRYARFFEHPFLNQAARHFLFIERRLDPRVVRWCRLTSWTDKQGVPWLQIPYFDREGRLTGIQNRNLAPSSLPPAGGLPSLMGGGGGGSSAPRFRFPSGSVCGIYNLPVLNLLRPGEPLYIAEGCSDCWSLLSAGHKAIAIPSATLLSHQDIELLSTLRPALPPGSSNTPSPSTQFHMYPDRDLPGERLFLQLQDILPSLVRHQLPPGCKDYSDYYLQTRP